MRSFGRFLGFGLAGLFFLTSVNAPAANTSDETAVRALVMGFQEAWNHHDMQAMGDLFTEDADLINVGGMHWNGKAAIVKALGVYHRTMFPKWEIHFDNITIRFVTPDVAVVVATQTGSGEITLPDGRKETPTGSQLDTFVMVKRDGAWKTTHVHNTIIDPDAQRFDPINSNWNGEAPR